MPNALLDSGRVGRQCGPDIADLQRRIEDLESKVEDMELIFCGIRPPTKEGFFSRLMVTLKRAIWPQDRPSAGNEYQGKGQRKKGGNSYAHSGIQ